MRTLAFPLFLPAQVSQTLLALFPAIRNLNIVKNTGVTCRSFKLGTHCTHSFLFAVEFTQITCLLSGWSSTLTRLGIVGFRRVHHSLDEPFDSPSLQEQSSLLLGLLHSLNYLPRLRHLTIDLSSSFAPTLKWGCYTFPVSYRLPILRQLSSFSLRSGDPFAYFLPSLLQYGAKLEEIRLHPLIDLYHLTATEEDQLLPLSGKIRHFKRPLPAAQPAAIQMKVFCGRYLNLSTLYLETSPSEGLSLRKLINLLAKLTHFRALHWMTDNLDEYPNDGGQPWDCGPLRALDWLTLSPGYLTSHTVFTELLPITLIFPKLRFFSLDIFTDSCPHCAFDHPRMQLQPFTEQQLAEKRHCARQLMAPLKHYSKQIVISETYFSETEMSIDDL